MSKTDQQFTAFLAANPTAYEQFERRTNDMVKRGIKRISADMIAHVVRYFTAVDGRPTEQFKLNNNYVAPLARMYVERNPDKAGIFEMRVRKAA